MYRYIDLFREIYFNIEIMIDLTAKFVKFQIIMIMKFYCISTNFAKNKHENLEPLLFRWCLEGEGYQERPSGGLGPPNGLPGTTLPQVLRRFLRNFVIIFFFSRNFGIR